MDYFPQKDPLLLLLLHLLDRLGGGGRGRNGKGKGNKGGSGGGGGRGREEGGVGRSRMGFL